jgi:hypothetical protein
MTGRISLGLRLSPIAAVLVLAACGGGGGGEAKTTTTTTTTATTAPSTTAASSTTFRVYFLQDGKVQPVARTVDATPAVAGAALAELASGPAAVEQRTLGLASAVPSSTKFDDLAIENGVATLTATGSLGARALAQVVYTLTQFPTVKAVETGGKRYTRADFEDETPAILVESPLPFQTVKSPLHATGTANTFEATFQYQLADPQARLLRQNFVTATSGNGVRGTFDFTQPFEVESDGLGKLTVYEQSAENGQPIHVVQIPLQLER